ncbi:MAG TPA: hypothetical protein VHA54_04610 [Solirubrobacterales bacterium]|nr:hypothetical protein [Solirubrobacterales bacterium]
MKKMRKRRAKGEEAINASESSRFSLISDALWSAQDSARLGAARAADSAYLILRDRLLLPLEDRAELAGAPARAFGAAVLVLLAIGAGVAGLLWAAPDHNGGATTVAEVAAPAPAPDKTEPKRATPAAPTLHGAAPDFGGVTTGGDATVGAGAPLGSAEPSGGVNGESANPGGAGNASAADAKISSQPNSATTRDAATASAAGTKPAKGPVAGPAAVAVAREFAEAFVTYEIGGAEDPSVQKAFAATTTPQLAQALLQRPPRQPATVKVPEAKVLNIVPAPSRGGVFPVSVSLLRVGTTSELRLEMQKLKGKRWRVTNVLG